MNDLPQTPPPVTYDDEIDLRDVFRVLWAGKWLIGGVTIAVTFVAVIVALIAPNIYRAEALLAPNDREGVSGLSATAARYGGLASLAGINLNSGSADKTALGLEILKSRKFVSEFIKGHDILVPLMAAKGWNAASRELIIDSDDYDMTAKSWVRDVRPPKKAVPSSQEAYEAFMKALSVSQDKNTGFVTVAIQHYSPDVAKQWVDWLIDDLNSSIMRQEVAEAEQAIEYLEKQIETTSLAGLQNVFFSLIEEQTKTVMLANVTREYLLKTLDPAVTPEKKYRPKRATFAILGFLLGGILGVTAALLRTTIAPQRNSQRATNSD